MVEELSLHNSRRNNEYCTVLQATSDDQLANVAQRLQEQLETTTVLSSTAAQEEAAAAGIAAHLSSSSDAAAAMACSSSDLSGWIEGMIEELTASNGQHSSRSPLVTTDSPHCTHNTLDSLLDTTGFPSQQAAAPSSLQHYQETLVDRFTGQQLPCMTSLPESSNSWMLHHVPSTTSYSSKTILPPPPSAPMERINGRGQQKVVNSNAALKEQEDSGVQLVHSLLACAEAVQHGDLVRAEETVCHIQLLASPPGPMGKVAAHFIEALTLRIYSGTSMVRNVTNYESDNSLTELLHFHYYETCPYLKFAHLTANQAILEAFEGEKQVHVIDFNLMHGLQWPALIQALALRPGGPPALLRLTGIGPPHASGNEIGMKLAQLAESVNIEFEFRGVVALKLDEVKPWMLQVLPGEAVAVNSVLQLHRLLYSDGPHVPAAIDDVLQSVLGLKPKIVTIVEHEANHNAPGFLSRFTEALHYYSTMFDSLEACNLPPQSSQQLLVEMYLGREICNIVACEGVARVERHENLEQWRRRMVKAGFQPLQLGLNALKQAKSLLTLFSGDGYRVEENNGCLTLGWHTRPLIASSAWQYA